MYIQGLSKKTLQFLKIDNEDFAAFGFYTETDHAS
jgi:hypothetical protein